MSVLPRIEYQIDFQDANTGYTVNDGTIIGIDANQDYYIRQRETKSILLYTSDTLRVEIDPAGSLIINGLTNAQKAQHLNDTESITLATEVIGRLSVFANDTYGEFFVDSTGAVTLIVADGLKIAITDTAGKLCVYKSGLGVVIKNNTGAGLTVCYNHQHCSIFS